MRRVRRSRVVLAPRPWRLSFPACAGEATVTKNAAHRGEHEVSRKAIAWGRSGCLGCTCQTRVRCFLFARGAAGAVSARPSLRPLSERGTMSSQNSGKSCRENADPYSVAVLPSAQLRTGAGTHTPRRMSLKRAGRRLCQSTTICGYGSLRSQGRQRWLAAPLPPHHTGSAIEYFTWLSAKLNSIEAMPSSRVSLFFRNASYEARSAATTRSR